MTLLLADPVARGAATTILEPDCALAILDASLPPDVAAAVAALDLAALPAVAVSSPVADLEPALAAAFAAYPAMLVADVLERASAHAALMGAAAVTVRLDPIATDACKRFHADFTTVRLLLTYVGRTTQWVRAEAPDDVRSLAAGQTALFKGRLLLDPPTVLHRSPPLAGTGERRLLLVIDPVVA